MKLPRKFANLQRWYGLTLVLLLAACGGSADQVTPRLAFSATLTGTQETPPNPSTGQGIGIAIIDVASLTLHASVVTSGVEETVAHIHQAPPGVSGPVVFPLSKETGKVVWTTTAKLTPLQLQSIQAGNFYFNVHSTRYPEGELRGQIGRQAPTREQLDRLFRVQEQSPALQQQLKWLGQTVF